MIELGNKSEVWLDLFCLNCVAHYRPLESTAQSSNRPSPPRGEGLQGEGHKER